MHFNTFHHKYIYASLRDLIKDTTIAGKEEKLEEVHKTTGYEPATTRLRGVRYTAVPKLLVNSKSKFSL